MKRLMFEIQGGSIIYKAEALSTKWGCLKGAEAFYKAEGYLQGGGVLGARSYFEIEAVMHKVGMSCARQGPYLGFRTIIFKPATSLRQQCHLKVDAVMCKAGVSCAMWGLTSRLGPLSSTWCWHF
jgi:hypothetical protein